MVTRQCQVRFDGGTTVLTGDHVFDVEREKRVFVLMRVTVLAPITGTRTHEFAKFGRDGHSAFASQTGLR
jgi:hypothetical protein